MFSAAPKSSAALFSHQFGGASASSKGGSTGARGTELLFGSHGKYSLCSMMVLGAEVSDAISCDNGDSGRTRDSRAG